MPTLCRSYMTEDDATRAVERLLTAGLPVDEIRVLMGEPARDGRDAPVGDFAGARHDAVGSFSGGTHSTADPMGRYAGHAGDERRGSFGDIDRETVTTYRDGVARVRIASHRNLTRMLMDAGLDKPTAAADVAALHAGRVLVLVRSGEQTADDLARALDAPVSV